MNTNALSFACRPNSSVQSLSDGIEVTVDKSENEHYILKIPKFIDGFELNVAEIVIGTLEEPILVFPLKLIEGDSGYISDFTIYKELGPIYTNVAYGGQCEGVVIWQAIKT